MISKPKAKAADLISGALCIRMSSKKQDKSPDQQRVAGAKLAEKYGVRIDYEYFDDGISGVATGKRKGFQQMLVDAGSGKFKVILAWDQDRFSRLDSIDSGEVIAPLRRAGVKLITVAQGEIDWNSFIGRMMFGMQQEGKHEYLLDLSRNVIRGKLDAVRSKRFFGSPPYGFDRLVCDERGELQRRVLFDEKFQKPRGWKSIPVPTEDLNIIATVRWVFDIYDTRHWGFGRIANDLNRRGVPSPNGIKWRTQVISRMLRNPAYVGDWAWNRYHSGKFFGIAAGEAVSHGSISDTRAETNHSVVFVPEADWIVAADHHEAIISREQFDRVQKRIGRHATGRKFRKNSKFLLADLLFCGHCGAKMFGHVQQRPMPSGDGHYEYRTYRCQGVHIWGPATCAARGVNEEPLTGSLLAIVQKFLERTDFAAALRAAVTREAKARRQSKPLDAKRIVRELAELKKNLDKGAENMLLADAATLPAMRAKLAEWRERHTALQVAQNAATRALPTGDGLDAAVDQAMALTANLTDLLRSGDRSLASEALGQIVDRVDLWFSEIPGKKRTRRICKRGLVRLKMPGSAFYNSTPSLGR